MQTLVAELNAAVAAIEAGLAAPDLEAVSLAAHAARNSALMIDAQPLLVRLAELESAARRDDLPGARSAQESLRAAWPPLRRKLDRAGGTPT